MKNHTPSKSKKKLGKYEEKQQLQKREENQKIKTIPQDFCNGQKTKVGRRNVTDRQIKNIVSIKG